MKLRLPLRKTPVPSGPHKAITCPVCRKRWVPWTGSLLPCHATCLLTDEAEQEAKDFAGSDAAFAEHFGLPVSLGTSLRRGYRKKWDRER